MAAVREYFETDFSYALRVHTRLPSDRFNIEIVILYDFSGYKSFLACYDADSDHTVQYYVDLLSTLKLGATELQLSGKVVLPSGRDFPGQLKVNNQVPFDILAKFHADPNWISCKDLHASAPARMFIYSESDLSDDDVLALKTRALPLGYEVQYRSRRHALERSEFDTPVGFVSYDFRDRDVSRRIAVHLNKMICPVWYDEFSLKVGDNLRESIEKGLKECRKCILLLSWHFLTNAGWTKREFDSIFTREILQEKKLVLPVWYDVTKQEVYEYSPSLLNVKGVDWGLGEDEVCRQLFISIMQ